MRKMLISLAVAVMVAAGAASSFGFTTDDHCTTCHG